MKPERFETIVIMDGNLNKKDAEEAARNIIHTMDAFESTSFGKIDFMGKKKLAYEMKGQTEAWYLTIHFRTNPENIKELERYYRITDEVLKFMTIKDPGAWDDGDEVMTSNLGDVVGIVNTPSRKTEQKPDALDVILNLASY